MGLNNDKETAGIDLKNSGGEMYTVNSGTSVNITTGAGAVVKNTAGVLKKLIVNSHTSGTFQLVDGSAVSTTGSIGGTYTPATGSSVITLEIEFSKGITILTAGTVNLTAVYK